MKLTLNKSNFEVILNNFQSFLDKKDATNITSHIYLETIDEKLLLKATDYEIGIQSKIDILNKIEDGIATVEGKKILDIVKNLKEGEIILETNDEKSELIVKQTHPREAKFKLKTFNAAEFNSSTKFPEISSNETKINLDSQNFIHSLKKVTVAADTNNQKMELTGTLIDVKDYHCNFVATDTRRLAIIHHDTQSIGSQLSIIIPKRAIGEIFKLFYEDFEIYFSTTILFIKSHNYIFFTKLINGKYPDYEKIIPKDFKIEFKFPKTEIIESIRLINSLSTNVKITFTSEGITFESMNIDESESANTQIKLPLSITEPITLGMNSKYILDFLAHIDSSEFSIFINEPNTPFLLKDNNYSTIIMPVLC